MAGAKLRYASLVCAVLIQADLSDADLDQADFMHAALNGTDLRGANLGGALFRHAVLGGCWNLDRAHGVAEARYLELGSLDVRTLRASLGSLSDESLVALGIVKETIASLRSAVGLGGPDPRSAA